MPRLLAGLLLACLATGAQGAPSSNDPALTISPVVDGLAEPTAMGFVGNGDFLILEKSSGKVRRVTNGVLNSTPVLDLAVEGAEERGLLGIAVHPSLDLEEYRFVYLYYNPSNEVVDTQTGLYFAGYKNVVDRFVWDAMGNGGTGSLTFDQNILTVDSLVGYHNGGSIRFGNDLRLYGVIGDGGHNDFGTNGQLQNASTGGPDGTGIVFRLTHDGSTPIDNPFAAIPGMEKVFAYGIRNSFGITFEYGSGNLWATENGGGDYDEINRIPGGMNGGWADIMGPTSRFPTGDDDLFAAMGSAYSDPEFSWKDVVAPTGIAFAGYALNQYFGDLFVGDFKNGFLYRFDLIHAHPALSLSGGLSDLVADDGNERDGVVAAEGFGFGFGNGGGISDLETGPDGALYVISFGNGDVHRVVEGGVDVPPLHDLAVSKVKAPKKISLSETKLEVVKALKVTIVNQGGDTETIDDLVELEDLVEIEWTSLAPSACPLPTAELVPPRKGFPVVLATKKKLNLSYNVTWDCANDPAQSSKDADHADFEVEATVDHDAVGGVADSEPNDDVCPRPASGDDKGCGGKDANGAIGGPIRTDVVVK